MKRLMSYLVILVVLFFVLTGAIQAQGTKVAAPPPVGVETFLMRADGPNLNGEVPAFDFSRLERPEEPQVVKPTEVYLVPVSGPNLTGKVPPLDKSRAIALHEISAAASNYVSGQWYDHYAYYTLNGTEVEQYTNFQERDSGQYIWFQRWENNNGGTDRWLKDGWTGCTYNCFFKWLSSNPTLNPGEEYTQGYGTLLQTYFQTNSSSCPCWLAQYTVGSH